MKPYSLLIAVVSILLISFEYSIAEEPKEKKDPTSDLPLVFSEDFEKGRDRWETTD